MKLFEMVGDDRLRLIDGAATKCAEGMPIVDGLPTGVEAVVKAALKNGFLAGAKYVIECESAPYPWCHGNPTIRDCIEAGYCRRDPSCGD